MGVFTNSITTYHGTMTTNPKPPSADSGEAAWASVPEAFRRPGVLLAEPWGEFFAPLRQGAVDDLVVVGQFGQSIDARIATSSGDFSLY